HDGSGLPCLRASSGFQISMRLWDAQLLKEIARHFFIVMLTGMNQAIMDVSALCLCSFNGLNDGGNFHKVGAGTRNNGNIHSYANRFVKEIKLLCLNTDSNSLIPKLIPGLGLNYSFCFLFSGSFQGSKVSLMRSKTKMPCTPNSKTYFGQRIAEIPQPPTYTPGVF